MFDLMQISSRLPSVAKPGFALNFNTKSKWTVLILVLYFILGSITVFGVNPQAVAQFEFLEIVFGSKMGSLITVGIGPIVTASIILQLLVGSKVINWNTQTKEGKAKFSGAQKILAILFCFFEAGAFVLAGAVPAAQPFFTIFIILQLAAGGILIMFMDEVCSKWGFGSGVSLFIAAGVAKTILVRLFSPIDNFGNLFFVPGGDPTTVTGIIWKFIVSLSLGDPAAAFTSLLPFFALVLVFVIVVFAQSMKIQIPMAFTLPFGKFAARRWPLKFIYTSNIPVILTSAVIANIEVLGNILYQRGLPLFGEFSNNQAVKGLSISYLLSSSQPPSLGLVAIVAGIFALLFAFFAMRILKKYVLRLSLAGGVIGAVLGYALLVALELPNLPLFDTLDIFHSFVYMIVTIIGAVIFSMFWVNTAGMDAHTVSEQFKSANIMIPGFRRDPRIIERVLERYIPALAVLGGAFVGFLAGYANMMNAIGTGTGILLTVMIIYQFYEQISAQHAEDMPPVVKKILGT